MTNLNDLNVEKVYRCGCYVHGFSIDIFDTKISFSVDTHEDIKIKEGVDIETLSLFDGDVVDISIDFWYYGSGVSYYDTFKQRIKAAWLLLRGRRATFDAFSFNPGQIRKLGCYLIEEADRLNELGYNDDGMKNDT